MNDMDKLIICIGRRVGAGGKRVASLLGQRLSLPVYDNELIAEAARKSGFSASLFKESDEKRHFSLIGSLFGSNRYGSFTGNAINEGELFRLQGEAIRGLAEKGSCIFVGRASDYILREMSGVVSVFLTAPASVRAEELARRENIDRQQAEGQIRKRDKARENWYNLYTFGTWGDSSQYDLCIDTSKTGIDGAAELICRFAALRGLL